MPSIVPRAKEVIGRRKIRLLMCDKGREEAKAMGFWQRKWQALRASLETSSRNDGGRKAGKSKTHLQMEL
jgi:hypothetical protein